MVGFFYKLRLILCNQQNQIRSLVNIYSLGRIEFLKGLQCESSASDAEIGDGEVVADDVQVVSQEGLQEAVRLFNVGLLLL